jgi:hypothetical protein
MSYLRLPDRLDAPMTRSQAEMLRSLSIEAYQPKQFAESLSATEAGSMRFDVKSRWPIRSDKGAISGESYAVLKQVFFRDVRHLSLRARLNCQSVVSMWG